MSTSTNLQEIFKDIPNYEGIYQVSNLGRVKSMDRTIIRSDGKIYKYKNPFSIQQIPRNGCTSYLSFSFISFLFYSCICYIIIKKIKNEENKSIYDLQVSFLVNEYMDVPKDTFIEKLDSKFNILNSQGIHEFSRVLKGYCGGDCNNGCGGYTFVTTDNQVLDLIVEEENGW